MWKIENPPKPAPVGTCDRASIELHAEWLSSGRRYGTRLELHHHDFSNKDLGNPNLTGARLLKVNLDGADLRYITLDDAELLGVSAKGANFAWASLLGAVFDRGSYVGARFQLVDFSGAQINGSDFTEVYLERTRWAGTRFEQVAGVRAHFGSSVLDAGRFLGCDLREASFVNAQTVLDCTTRARFEDCDLRDTTWAGRDLGRATFVRCKLAGSQGPVASLTGVTVTDCDLTRGLDRAARRSVSEH